MHAHPAADVAATDILLKAESLHRRLIGPGLVAHWSWKQSDLHKRLKAVADTDHGDAAGYGVFERGPEPLFELHSKDAAGSDIIAIAEAAGKGDEVGAVEQRGSADQGVEMDGFCGSAGEFKAAADFDIAIGAGGADDEGFGSIRFKVGHAERVCWETGLRMTFDNATMGGAGNYRITSITSVVASTAAPAADAADLYSHRWLCTLAL